MKMNREKGWTKSGMGGRQVIFISKIQEGKNVEERKQVGLEMTQSEAMAFSREKKNLNMA